MGNMTAPKISIIIRSYNDAALIERTLDAIYAQSEQDFEILIFDNESKDGTLDVLAKYPEVRLFHVPAGTYIPGRVMNRAAQEALGKILVYNNSDCVPQNTDWLKNLTAPLISGDADAAFGRQVTRPEAYPWVQLDYLRAFSEIAFSGEFFSMATSATLKAIVEKYPFDNDITYSEDILWAKSLREAGKKVVYVPSAIAEHSHNYTIAQVRKRFYWEGYADARIWGNRQSFLRFFKGVIGGLIRDFRWLTQTHTLEKFFPCLRYRVTMKSAYHRGLKDGLRNQKVKNS